MSVYETLSKINVNENTEKRGKFTYLSWVWAWARTKELYPDVNYKIYKNRDGMNYHHDGHTAWVEVGVTIDGLEYIEHLPVMDYSNNSIPVDKMTSFDVNKAIKRCLAKALAFHGLALYIYAGEDLPDNEREAKEEELTKGIITEREMSSLKSYGEKLEKDYGVDWKAVCKQVGADSIMTMTIKQHGLAMAELMKLEKEKKSA